MKRLVAFPLLVAMLALVGNIPVASAATGKKIRVAVMDFQNNSQWSWWGNHLGEAANDEFVTQLVNSGKFSVIERQKLQALLAEQSLGASGAVQASTAAKIGKLLGVQAIFTGSITAFSIKKTGGSIKGFGASYTKAESKLDVRMIDVNTGEILLAATGAGDKKMGGASFEGTSFEQNYDEGVASEALRPAVEKVTQQVLANMDKLESLAPAQAGGGKVLNVAGPKKIYIDGGAEGEQKVGDVFDVYRVTDEIKDDDGNVLDTVTAKVGQIVVVQVLNKSSICETKSGSIQKGDSFKKP
jgi:curli biogenesis system outer membrane secretion channel CsgG